MIRIARKELDKAVEALMIAAVTAQNTAGLRILPFINMTPERAEKAILAALTMLADGVGPATAADTVFVHTPVGGKFGEDSVSFPPSIPGTDHVREEEIKK